MKIVVFTAFTSSPLHYETDLEMIQRHLDEGDEVVHLHCNSELLACDFNIWHRPDYCHACIQARHSGLPLLSRKVTSIPFLKLRSSDRQELAALPKRFDDLDELRALRVDNFDLGWAVLGSIIDHTREPQPDIASFGNLVPRFIVAAYSVYRSLQNYLEENKPDRVYVFNARLAPTRAVLRACQSMHVPCFVLEFGQDLNHWVVFENTMPHDLSYVSRWIQKTWDQAADNLHRQKTAERFFSDRSKGVVRIGLSFIHKQEQGLMPSNWDSAKRNIAICVSSEDEFESVGEEYANPLYIDQRQGLEAILQSCSISARNIHLYLRVHPNLADRDNSQTRHLSTLKADFLTIVPAKDPVSTYELMQNAEKVVTFGLTVGIEAAFWQTPSILAGRAVYEDLGSTYNPRSHEDLISLLFSDLPAKDRTGAMKYGYFFNTVGVPFKYCRAKNCTEGTFKGQRIDRAAVQARRSALRRPLYWLRDAVFTLRTRWQVTGQLNLE